MFPVNIAAMMAFAFLFVSAPLAGFALLRSYEDFRKGVEKKSRLRLWSAFFGGSFLFTILVSSIMRFVVKSPERSISDYLVVIWVVFPIVAAIAGLIMLKAHEIFKTGVEQKKRIVIWLAFLVGAAVFTIVTFTAMKLVVS